MNDADIAKKTGQTSERIPAYKLNEVRMNGDDGTFSLVELLSPKNADTGKIQFSEARSAVDGVILKMRWKLSKFKEGEPSLNTSKYDNKSKDKVVLFGTNERGIAQNIKERFALTTQRVLYVYMPKQGEVVRLIVKPSGFSRKNPNDPAGLFDFQNDHEKASTYIHKFWTTFSCKFQEGMPCSRPSRTSRDRPCIAVCSATASVAFPMSKGTNRQSGSLRATRSATSTSTLPR